MNIVNYYAVLKNGKVVRITDTADEATKYLGTGVSIHGISSLSELNELLGCDECPDSYLDDLLLSVTDTAKTVIKHAKHLGSKMQNHLTTHAETVKGHVSKFVEEARTAIHEKTKPVAPVTKEQEDEDEKHEEKMLNDPIEKE